VATGQPVVLVFEQGDPGRPIVIGLLDQGDAANEAENGRVIAFDPSRNRAQTKGSAMVEADVDGKRLHITAADEIVLQCGKASVTLRRNGKVVIKGAHVETYSTGTNRIKGGQVRIN
jgi:uncharacterized protein involved in type VI secretion and phage assembly